MLYFPDANLAFVAVPKTGSTAVETAFEHLSEVKHTFGDVRSMHRPASWIRKTYGPTVEIVGVVREPTSWVISKYRYLCSDLFETKASQRLVGFDRFIKKVLRGEKPWPEPLKNQTEYLDGADTVFRYEDLDALVDYMGDRVGQTVALQKVNVSPAIDVSLSTDQVSALRYHFSADLNLYTGTTHFKPE
jgi:hypothetical protein